MPTALPRHSAVFVAAVLLLTPSQLQAGVNVAGRWTSKNSTDACWGSVSSGFCNGSEPVHMVLTRSHVGDHSQLLWYEGHQHSGGTWEAGLWGWNPATTTGSKDCSAYPQSSFDAITLPTPGYSVFCSGHSVLPDGKVLLSGGTIGGEGGDKRSILFNPATNTWAIQDTMEFWRWYPTNTALPDGKVLVSSGSMYLEMLQFGGRTTQTGSTLHADSLERFPLVPNGRWEVPAAKKQGYPSSGWPELRDAHSAVWMKRHGTWIIFGGREADTDPRDDVWFMYRNVDNDFSETYSAVHIETPALEDRPAARFRHAAVVPGNDDGRMFIFGGRFDHGSTSASITDEMWTLYRDSNAAWHWEATAYEGSPPPARQGHAAIWDPEHRNVLIFGGADAAENPIDSQVYRMHVPESGAMTWSSVTVDPDSASGKYPSPRHGHVFIYDEAEYVIAQGSPHPDYEYRAVLWGGKGPAGICSPDTLWLLWIPEESSTKNYRWQSIVVPGTKPTGRYRFGADIEKGTSLVVSGGDIGTGASAETWRIRLANVALPDSALWVRQGDNPKGGAIGHTLITGRTRWARKQELFDPTTGDWSSAGTIKRQDWYPFHFLLPHSDSTRVFYAGPNDSTYLLNLSASTRFWRHYPTVMPDTLPYKGNQWAFRSGSAVMYLPGKFMRTGSRDTDGQDRWARGTTMTLDLSGAPDQAHADTLHWVRRDSMQSRVNFNLVLLPDGKVFATGGTGWINNTSSAEPRKVPQLWNPATGQWTPFASGDTLANEDAVRGYHSNAILLPDGRVLAIGGNGEYQGDPASNDARRATVYCPPYLFTSSGTLRPRLTITPTNDVQYGTDFTVCNDDPSGSRTPSSLVLIRPASSTHGWNMEQRYVPLSFQSQCDGHELVVSPPANTHVAPPGDYLLFANLGSTYAPSIGQWIRLGSSNTPEPPMCICEGGEGAVVTLEGSSAKGNTLATSNLDDTPLQLADLPTSQSMSSISVTIRQSRKSTSRVDRLGMEAVNHAPGKEAFLTAESAVVGVRAPVSSASVDGADMTAQVLGQFGMSQQIDPGDTLIINAATGLPAELYVLRMRRSSRDVPPGNVEPMVHVQTATGDGEWTDLATIEPRLEFADAAVDSAAGRIRLFSTVSFQLQGVWTIVEREEGTVIPLELQNAETGQGEAALPSIQGAADSLAVSLGEGEALAATWVDLPRTEGSARTYFLRARSRTIATGYDTHGVSRPVEAAFEFALGSARPNPFGTKTTITYSLAHASRVKIKVYDVAGRLVRTLLDRDAAAGPGEVVWDGRSDHGRLVGSGVFFYRMDAGSYRSQRKAIVLGAAGP